MDSFYTPTHNVSSGFLVIDGDEFAHLTHVMRKKEGDRIRVADGAGNAYDVRIEEIMKRSARCTIVQHHHRLHEPEVDVTLAVALLKNGSKFDFLVEKCTELGVKTIIPLRTERTIPQQARTDRWQKLALAAMKQSMRCLLPTVHDVQAFSAFLSSTPPSSLKIIPHEHIESPLITEVVRTREHQRVTVCIGPEGGFSDDEIAQARSAGFQPVTLGPRRLRTETAAVVSVAFCVMS
jgi:16S rRNA (uracil1498-N3)-methyltransferase